MEERIKQGYRQRLSYYWLFPDEFENNFSKEVGARRTRTNSEKAEKEYFKDMNKFARKSYEMLKPGGFLCTVIGEPQANAFKIKILWTRLMKCLKIMVLNYFGMFIDLLIGIEIIHMLV